MEPPSLSAVALRLAAVLALVLANAFFVAAEFALVGSRRTRLDEMHRAGSGGAGLAKRAIDHLDRYISATQLGITLASLALGAVGEPFLARLIEAGFAGLPAPYNTIVTHSVAVGIAFGLHAFSQRTRIGKALLAIVQNPQAASLMGIDVTRAVMYCYAASTVLAGVAGILIAPLFSVSAEMGTLFGLKAFAVAILGGLNSARGVVLAGFLFGVVEALITSMLGSAYTNILAFLLVIVALAIRPHGLLGRAGVKKV